MDLKPGRVYKSKKNVLFKILPDPKNAKAPWIHTDRTKFLALALDGTNAKHWIPITYDGLERIVGRPKNPPGEWWAGARKFGPEMEALRKLLKKNFIENATYHRFCYFKKGSLVAYGSGVFVLYRNGKFLYKEDIAFEEKLKAKAILSSLDKDTKSKKVIQLQTVAEREAWGALTVALPSHREWPR